MDWVIRVEETRVGLSDSKEFVMVLTHVRNRGTSADWHAHITRIDGGAVVFRDTAPDAETLMVRAKQWIEEHDAIRERDPFPHNERDPLPPDAT